MAKGNGLVEKGWKCWHRHCHLPWGGAEDAVAEIMAHTPSSLAQDMQNNRAPRHALARPRDARTGQLKVWGGMRLRLVLPLAPFPPQQQPPPPPFVFSYTFIPQPPNISTQVYIFHICHILQLCSSFNFTPSLSLDSSSDPFQPHNHLSLLQIVLDVGVGHIAFLELFTRDQGPILAPSSPHSSPCHFAPPLLHMHAANFWFLRDTSWHDWLILLR